MAENNRAPADLNAAEQVALARADLGAARYNQQDTQTPTDNDTSDSTPSNDHDAEPVTNDVQSMGSIRNISTLAVPLALHQTRGFDASTRGPDCGICLEEMLQTDATYMHIGCSNFFHSGCYERALRESLNCPKCRVPVRGHGLYEVLEEVEELGFAGRVAPDMDAEVRSRIVLDDPEDASPEQRLNLRQQSRPVFADALDEWDVNKDELTYWAERRATQAELNEAAFNDIPGYKAQGQYHKDCLDATQRYHHEFSNRCADFADRTQRTREYHVKNLIQQRYKAHYHIHRNVSGQSKACADHQKNLITAQERDRIIVEYETGTLKAKQEYAQAREAIMQMDMKDCTDHRAVFHQGLRVVATAFDDDLNAARGRMRHACRDTPRWAPWQPYPPDPRDTGLAESRDILKGRRQAEFRSRDDFWMSLASSEEFAEDAIPYGPTLGGILLSDDGTHEDNTYYGDT